MIRVIVVEFVYSIEKIRRLHSHVHMKNVHIEFWQDVTSLLFAMRTSTVATALKKYLTMIISTHILTLSSSCCLG